MLEKPLISTLGTLPFFSGLPDGDIEYLASVSTASDYKKEDSIFTRGDIADFFYIILGGWVKLYRDTQNGEEAVLGLLTKGDSFGDISVLNGETYPFGAQAAEDCKIIAVPAHALRERAKSNPDIIVQMMASLINKVNGLQLENEHLTVMSASQRVGCLLLQLAKKSDSDDYNKIQFPYEKSLAASRLGMKPETFSRALAQLKDLGITTSNNEIKITDLNRLVDYVCSDCSAADSDCRFSAVHNCTAETRANCWKKS